MSLPHDHDDDRAWAARLRELPRSIEPAADLWPRVADTIAARRRAARARFALLGGASALAAAAAVALVVGFGHRREGASARAEPAHANVGAVATVDPDGALGLVPEEPTYRAAIAELASTFDRHEGEVPPEVAKTVHDQLRVLDEAIAATRGELAKRPQDAELAAQLRDEYQQELDVLHDVLDLTTRI